MKESESQEKNAKGSENSKQLDCRKLMDSKWMQFYFKEKLWRTLPHNKYNVFSVIPKDDPDRIKFSAIFKQMKTDKNYDPSILKLSNQNSRAIGALLGLGICDALGASTEFIPYDKSRKIIESGFEDIKNLIKNKVLDTRSGRIGIWTDDCSMALSMGDSLLINKFTFDPRHVRYMFTLWLEHGLNNGGRPYSIGLGGNISISMAEFSHQQDQYAIEGDKFNNGNGSLMRLAPIPICFADNQQNAMKYSGLSSRTTHNGDESKQCSKLLALILVRLIKRKQNDQWRDVINKACHDFETDVKSVKFLAESQQQPEQFYHEQMERFKPKFKSFNKKLQDRNWNWKDQNYEYSATRAFAQPGYVGSYCMDALAMALHTVWNGKSFLDIALTNANMGGDCDTVGAIAGQIAGAIYGIDKQMLRLYSQMVDFESQRYEVFLKGYKIVNKIMI